MHASLHAGHGLRGRKEFVGCGWDIEGGMAMSAICCDQSTVRLYVLWWILPHVTQLVEVTCGGVRRSIQCTPKGYNAVINERR